MSSNYKFVSQEDTMYLAGTSRQGSITATFAQLKNLLGTPAFEGKGDNVTTEFVIKWIDNENDVIGTFSLYDWNYARNFGNDYETITWNIGGKNYNDVMAADAMLGELI